MIPILAIPHFEWMPGDDHQKTFTPQDKLAMRYLAAGRTAQAIRLYRQTLADCERALGADHPYTFRSRNNLAMGYQAAGRTAEAIPLLERTLADCERVLGADHPNTKAAQKYLVAVTGEPESHRRIDP